MSRGEPAPDWSNANEVEEWSRRVLGNENDKRAQIDEGLNANGDLLGEV